MTTRTIRNVVDTFLGDVACIRDSLREMRTRYFTQEEYDDLSRESAMLQQELKHAQLAGNEIVEERRGRVTAESLADERGRMLKFIIDAVAPFSIGDENVLQTVERLVRNARHHGEAFVAQCEVAK